MSHKRDVVKLRLDSSGLTALVEKCGQKLNLQFNGKSFTVAQERVRGKGILSPGFWRAYRWDVKELLEREAEAALLEEVLAGHREAFARLVDAYKAPIFNLAFRMTGNLEDASDLAQETFVRAFVNIKKYNTNKRFFTWLYTIGLNIIRNHLRQKAHSHRAQVQIFAETDISDAAGNPEAGLLEDEASRRLTVALKCLTRNQREAVVLRFYQDLSFHEMAAVTGSSVSAVKMLTYRALERLRVVLADENL